MDKKPNQLLAALLVVAIAVVSWLIRNEQKQQSDHPPGNTERAPDGPDPGIHMFTGNPSQAVEDTKVPDNYLMKKPYFSLSYNRSHGWPNWVSWCLKKSDFGPADRVDFFPDSTLPQGFRRIVPNDYTNSGFDRGHMCPRSDRTATQEMSKATFVMTNITPQAPHLNQRGWNDLEEYSRGLVKHGSTLYIIAGVQGVGGEGSKGQAETIGMGRVTVPAFCWKVAVVVENGTGTAGDLAKIGPNTRTIAIIMPNNQSIGHDWPKYRASVKEVETLTGYTFFDRVPGAIADALKAKVDDTKIPAVGKFLPGD